MIASSLARPTTQKKIGAGLHFMMTSLPDKDCQGMVLDGWKV